MKEILYGTGDKEPHTETVAQLAQELYNSGLLSTLVADLQLIDFEVKHFYTVFVIFYTSVIFGTDAVIWEISFEMLTRTVGFFGTERHLCQCTEKDKTDCSLLLAHGQAFTYLFCFVRVSVVWFSSLTHSASTSFSWSVSFSPIRRDICLGYSCCGEAEFDNRCKTTQWYYFEMWRFTNGANRWICLSP